MLYPADQSPGLRGPVAPEVRPLDIEDKVYRLLAEKVEPFVTKLERREKETDRKRTVGDVFDESTLMTLYHLINRDVIDRVEGNLSSGKEANVFLGRSVEDEYVAIKIYRVNTTTFRNFTPYISGDPRFKSLPRDHRRLVFTWARKEFKNLSRLRDGGVRVPNPLHQMNNVLIMEYIGTDTDPARTLREVPPEDPEAGLGWAIDCIRRMVSDCRLVHSDLSEYNVLVHPVTGELVLIDAAQAVVVDHPSAREFLERDLANITRYFVRQGAADPGDPAHLARDIFPLPEDEEDERRGAGDRRSG